MISEFVIMPQVFEEIVSSYDEYESDLLNVFIAVLKSSRRNSIFVADLNDGAWKECVIILAEEKIEKELNILQEQVSKLKGQQPVVIGAALENSQLEKKKQYLLDISERFKNLRRLLEDDFSPTRLFPPLPTADIETEDDWLKIVNASFNPGTQYKTYPRPFCLITTGRTRGRICPLRFEHRIKWRDTLRVFPSLREIVHDSCKKPDDYIRSMQKLLFLSNSIAIVTPYAVTWKRHCTPSASLHSELEIPLMCIREKIQKYNSPYPLQKLIVVTHDDTTDNQSFEEPQWQQYVEEQKACLKQHLTHQFAIPIEVHICRRTRVQKIVDRKIYFGDFVQGGVTKYLWGVNISHFFREHDVGGIVSLLSKDDITTFTKMMNNGWS